nr:serine/threonine-protein kinase [uncultured Tolumonas sp.]
MLFPNVKIKDRYLTKKILGRGGMGEVWECFDEVLNRPVVLKIVAPDLVKARPEHTSIFIDEARIGASLVGHPNVVTVFDVINEDIDEKPILAIVMELVEGLSCSQWIEYLSPNIDSQTKYIISLQVAMEVCKALQYAHRSNILHRDIKPLNIFISKYGVTKLGDFGIARYADVVTREHTVWNFRSPAYAAPEQWHDAKPDVNTDIYQLGCTLYHLFTGQLPFEASNVAALIQKHISEAVVSPKVHNNFLSEDLSLAITESLAKPSNERASLWQIYDAIAKEVQHSYKISIKLDKNNEDLIRKVNDITEFNEDTLRTKGSFSTTYFDYNEAISEVIELALLGNVSVSLKKVTPKNQAEQPNK